MHSPPTVSVITATYNLSASLKLALSSLLNQDFSDFEAWIIGDACTDDSEEAVRSFRDERLHWVNLEENSGSQATPNNKGLELARGEYIAFLGHDDLWLPSHLSKLVEFIRESKADLVHSMCALFDPEGASGCIGPPKGSISYDEHFIPPSTWLHRHELIAECGLWVDPNQLALSVDFEYTRRAFRAGKRIAFCPALTVLKFPSWSFGAYSRSGTPPQLRYYQELQADAAQLEHEILLGLSIEFGRDQYGGFGRDRGNPWYTYIAARRMLGCFCRDHWPLSLLMRWRFQRYRKNGRAHRGLPRGR